MSTLVEATREEIAAERERRRERERLEGERRLTHAQYARDPVSWIDDHVWIASKFDQAGGRVGVREVKMRLWPDQVATIEAWLDLPHLRASGELRFRNVLIEKSRQIGETWLFAALVAWLLHHHRTRGLFMHTRAAEVSDRGWTIDSFFGRVRFIRQRLAPSLAAADWVFRPFSTDPAAIENPATGAMVRGECQRDDPGRGGTFDWAMVDEAAHVAHGELVHAAIDDACPGGKAYLSTPEGEDNFHARLCDERPSGWEYLRLHWSTHPIYGAGAHVAGRDDDCERCALTREGAVWTHRSPRPHRYPGKLASPWYDEAVIGKTDEQVAQELDIDRAGALTARVYPEFEPAIHVVAEGIPISADLGLELAWDFGLDVTSVIVLQDAPDSVNVVGILEAGDVLGSSGTPDAVVAELTAYLPDLGWVGSVARSIGDPAGQGRSQVTGQAIVEPYRRRGFPIDRPPPNLTARVDASITSVKLLLGGKPKDLRVCGVRARAFANHMRNNVWPTDATGARRLTATTPLDNVHNHACRAFAYWAVATYPPAGRAGRGRISVPTVPLRTPRPEGRVTLGGVAA